MTCSNVNAPAREVEGGLGVRCLFVSYVASFDPHMSEIGHCVKLFQSTYGLKLITSDQIRAARALVRWSAEDLARESAVGLSTVRRMEAATGVPSASGRNLDAVQRALERAGVEFIDQNGGGAGVRLRQPKAPPSS